MLWRNYLDWCRWSWYIHSGWFFSFLFKGVGCTEMIRKLSTDTLNGILSIFRLRGEKMEITYEQCSKSDDPNDLDSFIINGMGFRECIHCVSKERTKKSREVFRHWQKINFVNIHWKFLDLKNTQKNQNHGGVHHVIWGGLNDRTIYHKKSINNFA